MWTHKTLKKLVLETATLFQCPQLFYRPFNISLLFLTFFRYLKAKALKETIKLPWGTGTSLKNRFSKTVKNSKKAKHSSVDACITHCPKPVPTGLITQNKKCCCNKLSTQLKHLSSVVGQESQTISTQSCFSNWQGTRIVEFSILGPFFYKFTKVSLRIKHFNEMITRVLDHTWTSTNGHLFTTAIFFF